MGTGGLVRAYQDAVSQALSKAQFLQQVTALEVSVEVDYTLVGKIQNFLASHPKIGQSEPVYTDKAVFPLLFEVGEAERLEKELIELTNGKVVIQRGEVCQRLLPVTEEIS